MSRAIQVGDSISCIKCGGSLVVTEKRKYRGNYTCNACNNKRNKQWESKIVDGISNRERTKKTYEAKNPIKHKARKVIENLKQRGVLQEQPCEVCGITTLIHAHHDDYSNPREVRWFCQKHHVEYHKSVITGQGGTQ